MPVIILLFIVLWGSSELLLAAVNNPKLDRGLQRWLGVLMHEDQPRSFTAGTYDHSLTEQKIVAAFIELMQEKDIEHKATSIAKFFQTHHPLTPYFLEKATKLEKWQSFFQIENINRYFPERSCPQKRIIGQILASKQSFTPTELRTVFPLVAGFNSRKFKYHSFLQILRVLHKTKTRLKQDLVPHLKEFPHLKIGFQTVVPQNSISLSDRISYLLHEKKCAAAYRHLKKSKLDLATFSELALKIEKCYRRYRKLSRLRFWQNLRSPMQKRYGFAGWARAGTRVARLSMQRDRFRAAEVILQKIMQRAKKLQHETEFSAALFLLARVKEEKGDVASAIRLYRQYVRDSSHSNSALKSLALLLIAQDKWERAHYALEKIRKEQDSLPRDKRQTDILGFALLWQGRTYLHMGKTDLAIASWSRLLREFFSSYYGAIAHYMLEKLTGLPVAMSPAAKTKFEERMLYDLFGHREQIEVARSLYLLRLGLSQHAVCEIHEHTAANNGQMFIKALLLHAGGDWRESISIFSQIDRSYRETLPHGSERILFPKRFEEEIFAYAQKAGLDPFLALALIRQESLFNPKARSPAGARGLMQIMPRTALHEARRLAKSYISMHERKQIRKAVRSSRNNLFDVSTNVSLGMHYLQRLLSKYKNTVFTLSSYNAGITPTNRWLKDFPHADPMLFIAKIPYRETRNYVKLVLRNYFYYKRWYGDHTSTRFDYLNPVVKYALRL